VYASGDPDGRSFSDALKQAIVEQGGAARVEQIFHDPAVDPVAYDWTADVARLLGEPRGAPDVVVASSFPKLLVGFLKAWVDSDTKVPILHADGFRSVRVLESLDVSIEGYEGVSQAVLGEGPSARTFARDLEALTAQPPALRDAAAYDAAMTLMLATLRAGHFAHLADLAQVSGAGIRDSMRALGDSRGEPVYAGVPGIGNAIRLIDAGKAIHYAGASGACDDDRTGAVSRYRVQGGRFVEVDKVAGALVSSR
jgi:ABC-type branched-subunit amino acid transport system substrate-binding protein